MKFENKVKKFIKENFGITAKVADTFYSSPYHKKKRVYFPIAVEEMRCKEFMDNYREHYEAEPTADEFIISILHEVGHIKTTKHQLPCISEIHVQRALVFDDGTLMNEYFNIPQEQLATDFAYAWIKKHPKRVKRFWNSIKNDLEAMGYFDTEGEP